MADDDNANLIAQLQARLDALEQNKGDDAISIQRDIVAAERAKRIAMQNALKSDIRSQIARAPDYKPDGDFPQTTVKLYPTWVHLPDGKSVIANNRYEHERLLGKEKIEPAKIETVNVADLVAAEAPKKRGRPAKVKDLPLPDNLE